MKLTALEDLLVQELDELYDAETQILKALPKMAKAASRPELRRAFEDHNKQTKNHVDRLDRVFKELGHEPEKFKCEPITAITEQGDALASVENSDPAVVDAGLITVAQKVEHYEIAAYGSARKHASLLGYEKLAGTLSDTLAEEEETDALLTQLAERSVNYEAAKAPYGRVRTAPRATDASGGGTFGGLVWGLGLGALVALLFAPKTGQETRDQIAAKANEGADYLKRRSEDVRKSAEDLVEQGRQTIAEQRERVSSAMNVNGPQNN